MRPQMSINWWLDKENVVRPYNGILFCAIKEWRAIICYNMDERLKHAKWSKLVIRDHMLYGSIHVKCTELANA